MSPWLTINRTINAFDLLVVGPLPIYIVLHCLCSVRNIISTSASTTTTAATTTAKTTTTITTTTAAITTNSISLATNWFKSWCYVHSSVAIANSAVVWVRIYWFKGTHVTLICTYIYVCVCVYSNSDGIKCNSFVVTWSFGTIFDWDVLIPDWLGLGHLRSAPVVLLNALQCTMNSYNKIFSTYSCIRVCL